jgi:hypothetical protein
MTVIEVSEKSFAARECVGCQARKAVAKEVAWDSELGLLVPWFLRDGNLWQVTLGRLFSFFEMLMGLLFTVRDGVVEQQPNL